MATFPCELAWVYTWNSLLTKDYERLWPIHTVQTSNMQYAFGVQVYGKVLYLKFYSQNLLWTIKYWQKWLKVGRGGRSLLWKIWTVRRESRHLNLIPIILIFKNRLKKLNYSNLNLIPSKLNLVRKFLKQIFNAVIFNLKLRGLCNLFPHFFLF